MRDLAAMLFYLPLLAQLSCCPLSPPTTAAPTCREFKGPVTAVEGLEGYLLLASGNRIETCALTRFPAGLACSACSTFNSACHYGLRSCLVWGVNLT